jgi:hypothetical protein
MDKNEWLLHGHDLAPCRNEDSYGKLLEMLSRLEEGDDPKFTPEQAEFFKSLITSLIDTIRSFKDQKKS